MKRQHALVLPSLWDPRGVLKGVKFSALEVLETQGLPGEVSSMWWQRTTQKLSIPVIQERVEETRKGHTGPAPSNSWHSGSLPLLKPFSLTKVIWGWHLEEGWEIRLLQASIRSEGIRHSLPLVAQGRRLRSRL